jgi:CubicO group peptidase (beta-lactamase class C family)
MRYLAVLLSFTVASTGHAQLRSLDTAAVIAAVEREMQANRSPGVAVGVVIGDRVAFERGFGVASTEREERVTPATLFRIGSVTKAFTGLTAVRLAQRGTLDLQAPIGRVARGLHPSLRSITLHQLLSHMGGIIGEAANTGPHDDRALGDRVRGWSRSHTFAPPGDVYSYTGPGYWLAGYAIEQAAGAWFADVVTEQVLAPLGMVRSTFRPTMAMTWPVALDHRVGPDSVQVLRPSPDDASTWPSGSLYSSVRELSRFAIAFMNEGRLDGRQAIPTAAIATLSRRHGGLPGEECGYSYGLSTCRRGSVQTLSHYGFRVGSGAVLTMVPEHRVAIIVLSNRNGGIFAATERAILDQLLPVADDSVPDVSGARRPTVPRARFAGTYVNGRDTLRLSVRGDSLVYRYGAGEARTRAEGDSSIVVLGTDGEPVQQFRLVRGASTTNVYLHDGLNAFRRVRTP